jgi:hypothetical protein
VPGAAAAATADPAAPSAPPADIGQGAPIDPDTVPKSDDDAAGS